MTNLGPFFGGRTRAWADDRAFWERFAAFRIERTCGVEHASGGKCLVSPGHIGMHVLAPAEGETSLRYFDNSEAEPRVLSARARRWREGAGLNSIPRNEGPREYDLVLGDPPPRKWGISANEALANVSAFYKAFRGKP